MLERSRVGAGWGFGLILMLSACGSGKPLQLSKTTANKPTEDGQVRYLEVKNPSVRRVIDAADVAETAKFVQVEIVSVQNPKMHTATFRVEYQTTAGEKILLGAFTLYPSDKPGTFVVATRGKVKSDGSIVVTLIIPKDYQDGDILKVGVRKIEFLATKDS